jgi:hypothetical protein
MPITMQRLEKLLTEHEELIGFVHTIQESIKFTLQDAKYRPDNEMQSILAGLSAEIAALTRLPSHTHEMERQLYNRNARRNAKSKARQEKRRRHSGIAPRKPPGAYDRVEEELRLNREYEAFNRGESADAQFVLTGKHKAEKPLTNDEFLASLPPPEKPKSEAELTAAALALLDATDE